MVIKARASRKIDARSPMRAEPFVTRAPGRRAAPKRAAWRRLLRLAAWLVVAFLVAFLVASVAVVVVLRFVPVPTSAFMIDRRLDAIAAGERDTTIDQRWVPYARIAPAMSIAVVASEDQRFPHHHGFDFDAIADALDDRASGDRVRGASTISQQVAKNLFLWSGRSWVRKGLEAWFTVLIETCWPKRRVLEVYLNIAEFGDRVYGVEAASQRFFGKPASALTDAEAARLAAVLPNPKQLSAARPSSYVRARVAWIQRQMRQLGGPAYLDSPPPAPPAKAR